MAVDRRRVVELARHAAAHPERLRPYARRLARDAVLFVRHRGDHVAYYRDVVRDLAARGDDLAVGDTGRPGWLAIGKLQFDYLVRHGLAPTHRMLEIGCGNLRAGWRFIDYLEPGHYYGIDISPDIVRAAQRTVTERGLTAKLPYLTVVDDLRFEFLPSDHFDVVHAHSVFSHSPLPVIEECFAHVGRIMKPDGFFDFTFDRATGREFHILREDFYYRTETLTAAAARHGLAAEFMTDWEDLPHKQSKMRVRRTA